MGHRPNHPLILVVNADGSGYVKQYETLAEAKDAFKTIETSGAAYLYPPAKSSWSNRAAGYPAPISNNGSTGGGQKGMSFTNVQNIGFGPCPAAGTVLQFGDITDFGVQINGVYYITGYATYSVVANGECGTTRENTALTFVPNGTLLGSQDIYNYFSDGNGGYYEDHVPAPECPPSGTILEQAKTSSVFVSINASDYQVGTKTFNLVANGDCTSSEASVVFDYIPSGTEITTDNYGTFYSDGSGFYYYQPNQSCDAPDQFISRTTSDATIYIADINESVVAGQHRDDIFTDGNCGTYLVASNVWFDYGVLLINRSNNNYYSNGDGGFYSQSSCEDSSLHAGEAGWSYDGCMWSYTDPCPSSGTWLSGDSGNYTVNVGCGDFIVGSWGSATYADGNCGSYSMGGGSYYQNGTLVGNCNDYNYYSDGSGGAYQGEYTGGMNCPAAGTFAYDAPDTYVEVPMGSAQTYFDGNDNRYLNDGNCGYYFFYDGLYAYGTFITNYDNYNYYWDGSGGYYQGEYTGA